jgi:metal-responsive CopG/Arc/MetJ family transcriptional regulator
MGKKKEILIGLRVDKELLEELDHYSGKRNSARTEFIRVAIEAFIDQCREKEEDEYLSGYIAGKISEKEYLEFFDFPKVPKDIAELRKKKLDSLNKEGH